MTTTELKNSVLALKLEWGPRLLIPLPDRVREKHPELSAEEIKSLITWAEKASGFVFNLIEEDYHSEQKRGAGEIAALIRAEYPEISEANLAALHSQGMYYAWHG